eukprot:GHUV01045135.1.p1 GENE.GHUV01045135.1~~GHUV01045135.1.p1  ORF type:complete len:104 (+),score=6.15 GHUV01045135.1:362-673(+)
MDVLLLILSGLLYCRCQEPIQTATYTIICLFHNDRDAYLPASNPCMARSRVAAACSDWLRTLLVRALADWELSSRPVRSLCTLGYPWRSCDAARYDLGTTAGK